MGGRTMNHDEEKDPQWFTRIRVEVMDKAVSAILSELYTSITTDPELKPWGFCQQLKYVIEELMCIASIHAYNASNGQVKILRNAVTDADVIVHFHAFCRDLNEYQYRREMNKTIRKIIYGSEDAS